MGLKHPKRLVEKYHHLGDEVEEGKGKSSRPKTDYSCPLLQTIWGKVLSLEIKKKHHVLKKQ